uniref:Uncharacterized protein n=1 Tax=viral metagenome TaxID=1070528 RepID=A0A6C0E409_9ZZZZ
MDISIGGYKLSLSTLLLIVLVMFILTGHTICGCCDVQGFDGFKEGFVEGNTKPRNAKGAQGTGKPGNGHR